jgi:hypothetical protein
MRRKCSGCIILSDMDSPRSRKRAIERDSSPFVWKLFFVSLVSIFTENSGFILKTDTQRNHLIRFCRVCLPVVALFFVSGHCVNADPVNDFFSKVGQSIAKAFRPVPNETKKKTKHASKRPTAPPSDVAEVVPTPVEQPTVIAREQKRALPVPPEKAKGDLPYGIPVSGQKGIVTSPFLPEGGYIDVSSFAPGSAVKDPYTGKIFLVP